MKTAQTKAINGITYTVNQLGASAAVDLSIDLIKFAGPSFPIQQLMRGISLSQEEGLRFSLADVVDLGTIDLQAAFVTLLQNLDKKTFREVAKQMASVTTVNGIGQLSELYEAHFSQHGLLQLFKWLAFAVSTQYMDFFGALQSSSNTAPQTLDQNSKANR